LSRILGGKREALRHILPYLSNHRDNQKPLSETTVSMASFQINSALDNTPHWQTLVAEHLIKNAPAHETLVGLATRLLNINFGSIHTS
jgi:hypothetical protein